MELTLIKKDVTYYKRNRTMGRIIEKIKVRNAYDIHDAKEKRIPESKIRSIEADAIVDTGATYVCLSRKDIEALGLPFHKSVEIKTANGKASRRTFEGAKIELNGRTFVMEVMENDDDTPALIGYLLLEALDFVVDPKTQKVTPNPAHEGKWMADLY
jgi:predicted aspartyl protease